MRSRDPSGIDDENVERDSEASVRARLRAVEHRSGQVRAATAAGNASALSNREHAGELMAALSHDLRTPLGVVMGAFRELRPALPEEMEAYARMVERSTERLLAIAERLTRASALVLERNGKPRGARSTIVLRDAMLAVTKKSESALRVNLDRDVVLAVDEPSAVSALAAFFALADPEADPAVHVAIEAKFLAVRIALASEPRPDLELERAFGHQPNRSPVNLDLFFARIELEAQGALVSLHPVGRALVVRLPVL
jgi:signal transduction histidine kinase